MQIIKINQQLISKNRFIKNKKKNNEKIKNKIKK